MRDWGGIFGFTRMMTVLVIGRMQGFSLTNSLIKKLYSAKDPNASDDEQKMDPIDDKETIRREIESRETFSYSYWRFWYLFRFDKKCCLCCRPKKTRRDILFRSARGKLV